MMIRTADSIRDKVNRRMLDASAHDISNLGKVGEKNRGNGQVA
jgi:hypothetical protein